MDEALWQQKLNAAIEKCGTMTALAETLDVSYQTILRWRKEMPKYKVSALTSQLNSILENPIVENMYLCQRMDSIWESVDSYTYENSHLALDGNGEIRYSGAKAKREGDNITIDAMLNSSEFGILMRILGIREFTGSVVGGLAKKPEFIKFQQKSKMFLRDMAAGTNFKMK